MNEAAILFTSLAIIMLTIMNFIQLGRNNDLRVQLNDANNKVKEKEQEKEKEKKIKENIFVIESGDKGIIPNYGLSYPDEKNPNKPINFHVTYEVTIVEVSIDKVKVRATGYTSTDKIALEPGNKQGIINFLKDKWVNKTSLELIVDDSKRRQDKINKILDEK